MDSIPVASGFHPWDGFLVGPENALAHAGVISLARGEDPGLSPLVLHGPSGAGKSRLLAGLVAERLSRRPESALAHLDAETFASLCAEAVHQPGGWSDLRGRFRGLDLFVLEDLHVLERAPLALTELCHTLDALEEAGASVAVSARTGPGQWSNWPERLINRLMGGLSVRVDLPGIASRRRYVFDRARVRRISLAADAAETLARAADGYRTIDGLLSRLMLDARGSGQPISDQTVAIALAEDSRTRTHVTIDQVARAVAGRFSMRINDLRSSSRRAALIGPRHLAILLARRWTGLSFALIGQYFGGRDAATVRHACQMAANRLRTDPAMAAVAASLESTWRIHEITEA